jgi:hypothetical protein
MIVGAIITTRHIIVTGVAILTPIPIIVNLN